MLSDIQTLSAKKAEYVNVLEKSKELKNKRDAVLTSYNSISEADVERLSKVIPYAFDPVLLANDINSIASRYGMDMKEFKVSESKAEIRGEVIIQEEEPLYKTTSVTVTISGGFDQFLKFLKDIESSLHLIDVRSLSIKAPLTAQSGVLDYSLEMNTYSLR